MTHDKDKSNSNAQPTKGELSSDELKGASGGADCYKDPNMSIQKKQNIGQATHDQRQTGRVK